VSALPFDGGTAAQRAEVAAALDAVVDPCSAAAGEPAGLLAMGIVHGVRIEGGRVEVTLLPTFAGCLFTGLFAEAVTRGLDDLPWCRQAIVETTAEELWTEARMSPELATRLARRRALARWGSAR
jgi:metal-sulfur cluster biosynthetic enzyme